MSVEALMAALVGGTVVYLLVRPRKSREQRRIEEIDEEIGRKPRVGGFIDKRDYIEKARAEIRCSPGCPPTGFTDRRRCTRFTLS